LGSARGTVAGRVAAGRGIIPTMGSVTARFLGKVGELAALLWLTAKGYRLRHRNWHGAGGELDLVMERRKEIVFVEVKSRSGELYGGPVAAVDARKRQTLHRTAAAYLGRYDLWDRPCRFDVVTIQKCRWLWHLRHLTNVLRPDLGRQL
jgi:putative endonuclease